jgi:hypothetical protein
VFFIITLTPSVNCSTSRIYNGEVWDTFQIQTCLSTVESPNLPRLGDWGWVGQVPSRPEAPQLSRFGTLQILPEVGYFQVHPNKDMLLPFSLCYHRLATTELPVVLNDFVITCFIVLPPHAAVRALRES